MSKHPLTHSKKGHLVNKIKYKTMKDLHPYKPQETKSTLMERI